MTLCERTFNKADEAFAFLESLAVEDRSYIFRGHAKDSYLLQTTYARAFSKPHESWDTNIDELLHHFRCGLARIGSAPIDSDSRLDWMEFARHHGVPTPCLDFSYSPYVATFFAFAGIDRKAPYSNESNYSAVYAIDIDELALAWARGFSTTPVDDKQQFYAEYQKFLSPDSDTLFEKGFPGNNLQFVPAPSRFNVRMQRQQGALLYDTLQYPRLGVANLDALLTRWKEQPIYPSRFQDEPNTLCYKIRLDQKLAQAVFQRLELMGITGGSLYQGADGVALDVINTYFYNSRSSYLRDIRFPPHDNSEMPF